MLTLPFPERREEVQHFVNAIITLAAALESGRWPTLWRIGVAIFRPF